MGVRDRHFAELVLGRKYKYWLYVVSLVVWQLSVVDWNTCDCVWPTVWGTVLGAPGSVLVVVSIRWFGHWGSVEHIVCIGLWPLHGNLGDSVDLHYDGVVGSGGSMSLKHIARSCVITESWLVCQFCPRSGGLSWWPWPNGWTHRVGPNLAIVGRIWVCIWVAGLCGVHQDIV